MPTLCWCPVADAAVLITATGERKLAHLARHMGLRPAEVLELGLNALREQLGLAVGADGGPAVHRPA